MSTAIVIFAHGSSVREANEAVRSIAEDAARAGAFDFYEVAFLTLASPTLEAAVDCLSARGASVVLVVPYFLTLGTHLQRDLPAMIEALRRKYPNIEFRVAPPLDGHPALSGILADRARDALREWQFKSSTSR